MTGRSRPVPTILWITLIAGTSDISENLIFNFCRGIYPGRVFHYIASGLAGSRALHGGWPWFFAGIGVHYLIALCWTTVFFVLSLRIGIMIRRPLIWGLVFGAVVYLIMTFVALPLSGVPHPQNAVSIPARVNAVLALLFCFGVPVVLLTAKSTSR